MNKCLHLGECVHTCAVLSKGCILVLLNLMGSHETDFPYQGWPTWDTHATSDVGGLCLCHVADCGGSRKQQQMEQGAEDSAAEQADSTGKEAESRAAD